MLCSPGSKFSALLSHASFSLPSTPAASRVPSHLLWTWDPKPRHSFVCMRNSLLFRPLEAPFNKTLVKLCLGCSLFGGIKELLCMLYITELRARATWTKRFRLIQVPRCLKCYLKGSRIRMASAISCHDRLALSAMDTAVGVVIPVLSTCQA